MLNVASLVFFLHYVVWHDITGQEKMKIEMSSILFTGKSPSPEIVFVECVSQAGATFPISLSFKWGYWIKRIVPSV